MAATDEEKAKVEPTIVGGEAAKRTPPEVVGQQDPGATPEVVPGLDELLAQLDEEQSTEEDGKGRATAPAGSFEEEEELAEVRMPSKPKQPRNGEAASPAEHRSARDEWEKQWRGAAEKQEEEAAAARAAAATTAAKAAAAEAVAERLAEQCRSIERMTLSQLNQWYQGLGLPPEPDLERRELERILKKLTRWDIIPLHELRGEFAQLAIGEPEEFEDELSLRHHMIYQLLASERMEAWEAKCPQARRIGKAAEVTQVMLHYDHIDRMNMEELIEWYKSASLPVEKDLQKTEIVKLLKSVTVWHVLPMAELRKECEGEGIPVGDVLEKDEEQQRNQLVDRLLLNERMTCWDARGFEARRIGNTDTVLSAVDQFSSFQGMSDEELRQMYTKAGLPTEADVDRQGRLQALKTVLVWELLPAAELQKECRGLGLLTKEVEAANLRATLEERHADLLQRLKLDLNVKMNRSYYEKRDIPLEHLGSVEAASVAAQLDQVENMGWQELIDWYKGTGLPEEKDLTKEELVSALKKITVWSALPMKGLLQVCVQQGVLRGEEAIGDKSADWNQLLYKLLVRERLAAWEARGFPAQRMGNPEAVTQAVAQYVHFQNMSMKDLKKTCKDAGLAKVVERGMGRKAIVETLKAILIWELLPLAELRKDCESKKLPTFGGRNDERQESIKWLVAATFLNTWSDRGIPAERMGSLEVAHGVVEQVDNLEALVLYHDMIGTTRTALQTEYKKLGAPFDPFLDPAILVDRLKEVLIWKYLPMPALMRDCIDSNVSTAADPTKTIAFMTETTKRNELIKRLIVARWASSWSSRSIPAERVGSLEVLDMLLQKMDRLRSLGTSAIHGEYRKLGISVDPTWGAQELFNRLREAVIWEHLPMEELHRECMKRGVAASDVMAEYRMAGGNDAASRSPGLLGKIPGPKSWRPGGPETWRPGDLITSKSSGPNHPARNNGLFGAGPGTSGSGPGGFGRKPPGAIPKPFSGSINRPFGANGGLGIFKSNSPDASRLGAKASGAPPMKATGPGATKNSDDARRIMVGRLFENARLREWDAQGIPVLRLGDPKKAIQLIETVDIMSPRELMDWYKQTGFPEEKGLEKSALAKLAKMVTVWEALPLTELEQESKQQGLPAAEASEDERKKVQLVEQLLMNEQMKRWDAAGFQAFRIGNVNRVIQAIDQFGHFQKMSDSDLRKTYQDAGMPHSDVVERDEVLNTLKTVLLWELMPLDELESECAERKLPTDVDKSGSTEDKRMELAQRLRVDMSVNMDKEMYESKGIPVELLGTLMASRVYGQFKHIDEADSAEIDEWYRSVGFPDERDLKRNDKAELWKQVTIWSCLPPRELRSKCEQRGVSLSSIIRAGDIEEQRERLVYDLLLEERMDAWEAKGFPARHMGGPEPVLNAVAQFEHFCGMEEEELRQVYKDVGLPNEKETDRSTVLDLLKKVLIWELMPVEELVTECGNRHVSTDTDKTSNEEEKHALLLHRLKDDLRVKLNRTEYEAKGIPVERMDSTRVLEVSAELDRFQLMGNETLKKSYLQAGLPGGAVLERSFLLETLRKVIIWEAMPLKELQRDCLERKLPIHVATPSNNDRDKEHELVRRLITDFRVDLNRSAYEQQGIPVDRLGSLQASRVADQFEKLEVMNIQRLLDMQEDMGLPVVNSTTRQELLERLQLVTVWEALPVVELRLECKDRGVSAAGLPLGAREEEEREFLQDALKLDMFMPTFRMLSLPMHQIKSFRGASRVAREWTKVDTMSDAELARRYSDLGVSPQYLVARELRERLKKVAVWIEMPVRDLQQECIGHRVFFYGQEAERHNMVRRLAATLWPAKPNPFPHPPPQQPPPFGRGGPQFSGRPPPPRPPPVYTPQNNKMAPYFRALELPNTAGFEEVKKAYRKLALKYHPDKNAGPSQEYAARSFRNVAEAYEKLSEHFKVKGKGKGR